MEAAFDISNITTQNLDDLRLKTDPIADDVIAKILTSGFEKQINQVFMALVQNNSFDAGTFSDFDPDLATILNDYFESTGHLPEWADMSLIKGGEKVFSDYGPEIFMLLNLSSLPLCYTCARGAQVLYDTGRLLEHNSDIDPLVRRLMETAQMIVDVMAPGGLAPNGKGIATIQKVRLVHASIRYYLKKGQHNNTPWNVIEFGEPINQEDLAGTLMSFGPVLLNGLKQLNVEMTVQEINAYMHCWKVAGYLIGIEEGLLPDTYEEGFDFISKILSHQAEQSEAGKALTASCIQFINYIMPGNAFDDMPNYLMNFFLQDFSKSSGVDLSQCIGVTTKSDVEDKLVLSLSRYVVGKISDLEQSLFIQKIISPFNKILLQGIIHHYNGGKGVYFLIPPSLQKDWGLMEEWSDYKVLTPNIMGNRLAWQKNTEKLD